MSDTENPELFLERLIKPRTQKSPVTGDLFRLRPKGGGYFYGLVVDGNMQVGPLTSGSILGVVFETTNYDLILHKLEQINHMDDLDLLIPPFIVNQRPWTQGYAEKMASTSKRPNANYYFRSIVTDELVDQQGNVVSPETATSSLVGVWGLGSEYSLALELQDALSQL